MSQNMGLIINGGMGMADVLIVSSSSEQTKNEQILAFMKLSEIIWNKVIRILEIVIKVWLVRFQVHYIFVFDINLF